MEKHKEASEKKLSLILLHNFLGGIAWGLGITIGASIVLALGGFLLTKIDYVPFVGNIVVNIIEFVQQNNPNL